MSTSDTSIDNTTGIAGEQSPVPMRYTTLNTGAKIPLVGFGVYQVPPAQTKQAVLEALKAGYRLIDTAEYYRNDRIGLSIRGVFASLGMRIVGGYPVDHGFHVLRRCGIQKQGASESRCAPGDEKQG